MNETDILVSGATGRTGVAAIDTLWGMGKRVRAYVRSDHKRAAALRQRGVDIAVGDFTDIDYIRAPMEGVRSAYFLHPIAPGIIGAAAYFAQAAKEAGVSAGHDPFCDKLGTCTLQRGRNRFVLETANEC